MVVLSQWNGSNFFVLRTILTKYTSEMGHEDKKNEKSSVYFS